MLLSVVSREPDGFFFGCVCCMCNGKVTMQIILLEIFRAGHRF